MAGLKLNVRLFTEPHSVYTVVRGRGRRGSREREPNSCVHRAGHSHVPDQTPHWRSSQTHSSPNKSPRWTAGIRLSRHLKWWPIRWRWCSRWVDCQQVHRNPREVLSRQGGVRRKETHTITSSDRTPERTAGPGQFPNEPPAIRHIFGKRLVLVQCQEWDSCLSQRLDQYSMEARWHIRDLIHILHFTFVIGAGRCMSAKITETHYFLLELK